MITRRVINFLNTVGPCTSVEVCEGLPDIKRVSVHACLDKLVKRKQVRKTQILHDTCRFIFTALAPMQSDEPSVRIREMLVGGATSKSIAENCGISRRYARLLLIDLVHKGVAYRTHVNKNEYVYRTASTTKAYDEMIRNRRK